MKPIFKPAALVSLAGLGLMLAACGDETAAEEQVEAQAEALDDAYAADAAMTEAYAQGGPNEEQAEEQADALREKGDRIQDRLKEEADQMGEDTEEMREAD